MTKEYGEIRLNGDVPKWMKLIMLFIDRVGFPVLAFCLMFYMSYVSLSKATDAISENTKALTEFATKSNAFQQMVSQEHGNMSIKLEKVLDNQNTIIGNTRT